MGIFKTIKRMGEWDVTLKTIATTFNAMNKKGYSREQILHEHFNKRYKHLVGCEGSRNNGKLEMQRLMADEFAYNFQNRAFGSTAEYVAGCLFIEYYPSLLLEIGDSSGRPLFGKLVSVKNDNKELDYELSNLGIYLIIDTATSVIKNILDEVGIENVELVDFVSVERLLSKTHSAYRSGDYEKKGIDNKLLIEIILTLIKNGYSVEIYKHFAEVNNRCNLIIVRGKDRFNIFGGKLPLTLEYMIGSYDTQKCMNKFFDQKIDEINKLSQYGEWSYEHIPKLVDDNNEVQEALGAIDDLNFISKHGLPEFLNHVATNGASTDPNSYSETIISYTSEVITFTDSIRFIRALTFISEELDKLTPKLTEFQHNKA